MCRVTQMGVREKNRREGRQREIKKEVFHLKNERMLQTQEGPPENHRMG